MSVGLIKLRILHGDVFNDMTIVHGDVFIDMTARHALWANRRVAFQEVSSHQLSEALTGRLHTVGDR